MRYKFTKKSDIDKLDPYLKLLLHMLANKPLSENIQSNYYNKNGFIIENFQFFYIM